MKCVKVCLLQEAYQCAHVTWWDIKVKYTYIGGLLAVFLACDWFHMYLYDSCPSSSKVIINQSQLMNLISAPSLTMNAIQYQGIVR